MATLDEPLSIRQLEVFVALVDQGSFTRAARFLGLSQSTVSGHVADLERRLGGQVVERGRRGVSPTAVGDTLLAPARETLKAERTARMAVEELTGLLRGVLTVGASTIPTSYLLPAWYGRFHAVHPDIRLRTRTSDSRGVLEWVLASDAELGVVGMAPDHPGLEHVPVASDHLVLVAHPEHPLAARAKEGVEPEAVLDHPLVLREEGSGTRDATLAMLAGAGADTGPDALDVVCEVGSTEGAKAAVRAGLGLAFVSDLAVADEIRTGALVAVPVRGCETERTFFLVVRKGGWLGPAARAFRDVVVASARSTGPLSGPSGGGA